LPQAHPLTLGAAGEAPMDALGNIPDVEVH
jgi:hypothetical protein